MQPSTLHHFRQSSSCLALAAAGLWALGAASNASQDPDTATGAYSTASEANSATTGSGRQAYGDYSVANGVYAQAGTIQTHLSASQACAQGFLPVWTDKTSLQCLKELP